MTIRVQANHKYIDEIQSVAQIFFPHARFRSDETPLYTITSLIENGEVYAEIIAEDKHAGILPARHCLSTADRPTYLNDKRMAMLAVYHLMQNTIGAYAPWGALTGVRPTKMVREWLANGQSDNEIFHELQSTLCVHEDRAKLAVAVAHAENHLANKINPSSVIASEAKQSRACSNLGSSTPLGLYISIPFCPSRCVYCSFNTSHTPWGEDAQARYIQAVVSECREVSYNLRETGNRISSLYIGGGTPTALTDSLLESLLNALQETATPTEYTVEAGRPDTITRSNLQLMRKYGVNRVSINPQTMNDRTLETIGRNHTISDFLRAFQMAREEGFTTINTDIIAGLPGEGPEDMRHTMDTLAALKPENITIHTLAVKRASKLNEHRTENALSNYALPDAKPIESQLKIAHDDCIALGLSPYYLYRQKNMAALFENTGYSLPGHECLYNVGMMSEVQTVLGVGAGAVSKFIEGTKITRKFNVKNPEIYIERACQHDTAFSKTTKPKGMF